MNIPIINVGHNSIPAEPINLSFICLFVVPLQGYILICDRWLVLLKSMICLIPTNKQITPTARSVGVPVQKSMDIRLKGKKRVTCAFGTVFAYHISDMIRYRLGIVASKPQIWTIGPVIVFEVQRLASESLEAKAIALLCEIDLCAIEIRLPAVASVSPLLVSLFSEEKKPLQKIV